MGYLIALCRPQTKRLRAQKICLSRPSGDVSCAGEDMACGYWFSKFPILNDGLAEILL